MILSAIWKKHALVSTFFKNLKIAQVRRTTICGFLHKVHVFPKLHNQIMLIMQNWVTRLRALRHMENTCNYMYNIICIYYPKSIVNIFNHNEKTVLTVL